jgi:hypothetical protein
MFFSSVATDSLLLFAMFGSFFTVLPAVVMQLFALMSEYDEQFGKRQYFNLAKMTFLTGLLFAGIAVCIHIFAPDNVVPDRSSVPELWAMLWVAPVTSLVLCFVTTGLTALVTVLWRVIGALLKYPVGWWCALMGRTGDSE